MAAGLALLAGVLSLIATGDRSDVPVVRGEAWPATYAAEAGVLSALKWTSRAVLQEARRSTMERTPPSGTTRTQSWEPVTAQVTDPASSSIRPAEAGFHLSSASDGVPAALGAWLGHAESWIRRYPWPTVTLGIAAGFLLARWRRYAHAR